MTKYIFILLTLLACSRSSSDSTSSGAQAAKNSVDFKPQVATHLTPEEMDIYVPMIEVLAGDTSSSRAIELPKQTTHVSLRCLNVSGSKGPLTSAADENGIIYLLSYKATEDSITLVIVAPAGPSQTSERMVCQQALGVVAGTRGLGENVRRNTLLPRRSNEQMPEIRREQESLGVEDEQYSEGDVGGYLPTGRHIGKHGQLKSKRVLMNNMTGWQYGGGWDL